MYQVWQKADYAETWTKVDCGDKQAVIREIEKAWREGKEPLVTMVIPYEVAVKMKEDKIGEAPKDKAKPDKVARGESEERVRPGDEPVTE